MNDRATIELTIDESDGTWDDLVRDLLAGDLGPSEELTAKKLVAVTCSQICLTCYDCIGCHPGGC